MMTNETVAADMVWTSLSLEAAQRLLLAYYAGFPFLDGEAQLELHERGLLDGETLTVNGRTVVKDRTL